MCGAVCNLWTEIRPPLSLSMKQAGPGGYENAIQQRQEDEAAVSRNWAAE